MTNKERLEQADRVQSEVVSRTKEFETNKAAAEIEKMYKIKGKNHENF